MWGCAGARQVEWTIYWSDAAAPLERAVSLLPFQKLNHFPGMTGIARKAGMARRLSRMKQLFPEDYAFFPRTWILPADYADFKAQFPRSGRGTKTFILKPDAGCQGRGIFLTRAVEDVDPHEPQVAQRYIRKPLLIDGLKFDLRVYILVVSCDPLRVFLFREGLVRLCTLPYEEPTNKNMEQSCMHLTNYSLNKFNSRFVQNEGGVHSGTGNKRSITWFRSWLREQGHDPDALWQRVGDMCVKLLISIQPELARTYRSCWPAGSDPYRCFELLGIDVMVDSKLRPWLIEVNHAPSFSCDSPLDKEIKAELLTRTLSLLCVSAADKRRLRLQRSSEAQSRLYGGHTAAAAASAATATAAASAPTTPVAAAEQRAVAARDAATCAADSAPGAAAAESVADCSTKRSGDAAEPSDARRLRIEHKHRDWFLRIYPPSEVEGAAPAPDSFAHLFEGAQRVLDANIQSYRSAARDSKPDLGSAPAGKAVTATKSAAAAAATAGRPPRPAPAAAGTAPPRRAARKPVSTTGPGEASARGRGMPGAAAASAEAASMDACVAPPVAAAQDAHARLLSPPCSPWGSGDAAEACADASVRIPERSALPQSPIRTAGGHAPHSAATLAGRPSSTASLHSRLSSRGSPRTPRGAAPLTHAAPLLQQPTVSTSAAAYAAVAMVASASRAGRPALPVASAPPPQGMRVQRADERTAANDAASLAAEAIRNASPRRTRAASGASSRPTSAASCSSVTSPPRGGAARAAGSWIARVAAGANQAVGECSRPPLAPAPLGVPHAAAPVSAPPTSLLRLAGSGRAAGVVSAGRPGSALANAGSSALRASPLCVPLPDDPAPCEVDAGRASRARGESRPRPGRRESRSMSPRRAQARRGSDGSDNWGSAVARSAREGADRAVPELSCDPAAAITAMPLVVRACPRVPAATASALVPEQTLYLLRAPLGPGAPAAGKPAAAPARQTERMKELAQPRRAVPASAGLLHKIDAKHAVELMQASRSNRSVGPRW